MGLALPEKCVMLAFDRLGTDRRDHKTGSNFNNNIESRRGFTIFLYLTLRLLISYIYIYIYIYIYTEHLFLMFRDHTQRRTTVGRTPLDE